MYFPFRYSLIKYLLFLQKEKTEFKHEKKNHHKYVRGY